jgi:hypothetical protein
MIRRPQSDEEQRVANALPQSLKQEAQGDVWLLMSR